MTEPLPKVPVETIIEKIDKPKSSGVAIKIMVGLLILIVLSEVGYLVYNNYFKPGVESLSGPTIESLPNNKDHPAKSPLDASPTPKIEKEGYASTEKIKEALSRNDIIGRKYDDIILTYKVKGEVIEKTIITHDYISTIPTEVIVIKSKYGGSAFALPLEFGHRITIMSGIGDNLQNINYNDIEIGDIVTIRITLHSSESGEEKITVITKVPN